MAICKLIFHAHSSCKTWKSGCSNYKKQGFWRQEAQNLDQEKTHQPVIYIHIQHHPTTKTRHSLPAPSYIHQPAVPYIQPTGRTLSVQRLHSVSLHVQNSGSHLKLLVCTATELPQQSGNGTREDYTSCAKWQAEESKHPSTQCMPARFPLLPTIHQRTEVWGGHYRTSSEMITGHQLKMQLITQMYFKQCYILL